MTWPDHLSEHFTLSELTVTKTGLPNNPPETLLANAAILCALLEKARAVLNVPMIIAPNHSGYRSPQVNIHVGGATNSAHTRFLAADFEPGQGMSIDTAFEMLRLSSIGYDKLIMERNGDSRWIHIQAAEDHVAPRGWALTCEYVDGKPVYRRVD